MIARIWHGATVDSVADEYLDYLDATGVKDYRATEGNRGVYVLRRVDAARADFVILSLWDSFDAIRRFAGEEDPEAAVYYPEDRRYLLELEPRVTHYEVFGGAEEGAGPVTGEQGGTVD